MKHHGLITVDQGDLHSWMTKVGWSFQVFRATSTTKTDMNCFIAQLLQHLLMSKSIMSKMLYELSNG